MAKHDSDILSVLPTPSSPTRWMTTPDVRKRLEENGIAIAHTKTVQRRLEALEQLGVVNCRDTGHALEWQRKDGASGIAAKAGALMTFEEALALQRRDPSLRGAGRPDQGEDHDVADDVPR